MSSFFLNRYHTFWKKLSAAPRYLAAWLLADAAFVAVISSLLGSRIPMGQGEFLLIHLIGIGVGTIVMFTGLGAGVLWIPILTFLNIRPSEAVSISIFTQIAGKGIGSLTYLYSGLVDMRVARQFVPMALVGVCIGYLSGFMISMESERYLLYIFIIVAVYLLFRMIQSLYQPDPEHRHSRRKRVNMYRSYPVVVCSSFFTGLLSIGNTDWLIPHMEHRLQMSTPRAVATGLFVMFITSLFYLFMVYLSVQIGIRTWPQGSSVLFATCSGVMVGSQIGTRLLRFTWFREHQKHAFILLLTLSIIHLLW